MDQYLIWEIGAWLFTYYCLSLYPLDFQQYKLWLSSKGGCSIEKNTNIFGNEISDDGKSDIL